MWTKADNFADSIKVDQNDWLSTRIAHEGQKNPAGKNRSSTQGRIYDRNRSSAAATIKDVICYLWGESI